MRRKPDAVRACKAMRDIFGIIGENIRRNRKRRGLTQERLAELAGLSTYFVGSVERGQATLSMRSVAQIASALQVPLAALVEQRSVSKPQLLEELMDHAARLTEDQLRVLVLVARTYEEEGQGSVGYGRGKQ